MSSPEQGVQAQDPQWTRSLIEKLASESLVERRRARRWSILFRLILLVILIAVIASVIGLAAGDRFAVSGDHVAVIELHGILEPDGAASAERINAALTQAFKASGVRGIILRINSPGGSPVQAGQIYDHIRRLRAQHPTIRVHAVVEEICASGAYYVAAAADRIYVDKASLVGSIGVLLDGYGFSDAMAKLGVERRLLTAGANKGFLDAFSPLDETHRLHAQKMLDEIHQQFISAVRVGRGERLSNRPELFTGLIWTGARSIELGLVDEIGTVKSVAGDVFGTESLRDYTPEDSVADRIAKQIGAALGTVLSTQAGPLGGVGQTAPVLR